MLDVKEEAALCFPFWRIGSPLLESSLIVFRVLKVIMIFKKEFFRDVLGWNPNLALI